MINAARGLTKSYGEKLGRGNARSMKPKAAQDLSPELKNALGPLMREIESVSERIRDYDELLESMAQNKYPEAERLKQIKGVGTLIALTYMLTLEDPRVATETLGRRKLAKEEYPCLPSTGKPCYARLASQTKHIFGQRKPWI